VALPVEQQLKYWGIAAAVFVFILWALGDVLTPFVLAGAIAYCLDPIADWFEARGLSRGGAVLLICILATLLFVLVILLVVPTLIRQGQGLVGFIGDLVNQAPELSTEFESWVNTRFGMALDQQAIRDTLVAIGAFLQERTADLATGLLNSAASLVNVAVFLVLVPVTTVYLLIDWDRMVATVDSFLPRDHAPVIRAVFADIDRTLASFIRGMGTVSLMLGTYYAVSLALVGLNFGVVIGAVAGLITFIPYVGALVGGILAIGVALVQFWGEWWWIVTVAVIFQAGQIVEGNFLTPKLVGSSVGLHPVWLLVALSVFGTLFGFIGLLVAVPMAAVIGVLVRFALSQYTHGRLYQGVVGQAEAEARAADLRESLDEARPPDPE